MINKQSGQARQVFGFATLGLLVLLLSACAATGSRIKAYEGPPLADAQTATLEAPSTIKVLSINGQDTQPFMLEDLALNYSLAPGSNRVVFRYRSIWSKPGPIEDGESAVIIAESGLLEAEFEAQAGETYTLAHSKADNVREARRMAQAFSARIVNSAGRTVARSEAYDPQGQSVAAAPATRPATQAATAPDPAPDSVASTPNSEGAASGLAPNMSTLDALNLLWQRATREEKEAFLRQAFEAN